MPIPTCECSVCHQTVNKAQTYAVGDGKRACKSHQGVVEQAEAIKQKAKDDKKAAEERKKRAEQQRREEREERDSFRRNDPEAEHWRTCECWLCGCEALPLQVYFHRQLIVLSKQEMRGTHDYVGAMLGDQKAHEQNLKDLGIPVGTRFYREVPLPQNPEHRDWILRHVKGIRDKRFIVGLLGCVHVCADCAKKYNLPFWPEQPKLTPENMKTMAIFGAMKIPSVEEAAKRELETDRRAAEASCPHCADPRNETSSPDCPNCHPR
jgi:hypothetical protein